MDRRKFRFLIYRFETFSNRIANIFMENLIWGKLFPMIVYSSDLVIKLVIVRRKFIL